MAKAPLSTMRANRRATFMGFPRDPEEYPRLQLSRNRSQLDLRLCDRAEQLESRIGGLELRAPRIEELEQRRPPQPIRRFRHVEEGVLPHLEAPERLASQL